MLTELSLENFKAFCKPTHIPLAPITLIFGENSAGKSTILQALALLKQSHDGRDSGGTLLPRAEEGLVDLGGFHELLFDHDPKRVLRIGLAVDTAEDRRSAHVARRKMRQPHLPSLGLRLSFSAAEKGSSINLVHLDLLESLQEDPLARFACRKPTKEELRAFARGSSWLLPASKKRTRSSFLIAQCEFVSSSMPLWRDVCDACLEQRDKLVRVLKRYRDERSVGTWSRTPSDEGPDSEPGLESLRLDQAIEFYSTAFDLDDFVSRMVTGQLDSLLALDGFLPGPWRRHRSTSLPELEVFDLAARHGDFKPLPMPDAPALTGFAGRLIEDVLFSLFPMGPYRRPPQRWYIFSGSQPSDVGTRGELLPDLLYQRPELVEEVNGWLRRLEVDYSIAVRSIGGGHTDLFEVRLLDARRSPPVEVALPDVGFGISQMLPFVVHCLASTDQIISIEQPEVHIHPRLQAELGELLARSIKAPYRHQFLIETHSEHLILRVQKLVRDGLLIPDDVSVIHVSRAKSGSVARRLNLDHEGDFVDDWPGGFFPERLRELRS